MSEVETQSNSNTSDYRIDLTDIRGVGPKTVEKLEQVNITSVRECHLLRGVGATYRNLTDKGVGSDTLKHLQAVGKAVHYSGNDRMQAKHLTGPITDEVEFSSSHVDISAQKPDTSNETDETVSLPEYDTDRLQSALDCIHDEYGEGYGEQVSFEGDLSRFLHESDTYNGENHNLPTGIVQSVMRYRHDAKRVESQGDFESHHKAVLVDFSNSL